MSEADEPQNKASLKVDDPKAIYKLSSFILILEDAEDCNDSAIKLLKKQLRRVAGTATSVGWTLTIHAGGMYPGVAEAEIFL